MERSDAIRPGGPSKERAASSLFGIPSGWLNPPVGDSARAAFVPLHYESNYAYPLIVWLHGPGDDERQLFEIMPLVSQRNYVAVAPRGLRIAGQQPGEEVWGWPQTSEHISQAEQRIFDSIETVCRKLHVAPARVFLAGSEAGGTMAFRAAMNYPARFAGVLSLGGPFPSGQTPLGQWTAARSLAVFLAIGRDSLQYPPVRACDDLRLFHAAGISVTLRQYPCGPLLSRQVLGDMDRWIMEQIAASPNCVVRSGDRSACSPD